MNFIEKDKIYLAQTYARQPIAIIRGKGATVWDIDGKEYLDFVSGISVLNVGHCHRKVIKAIKEQCQKIMHTSNLYYIIPQIELAELLYNLSGGYKSFFCNSGAEANEAAIKLARKYTKKKEIICAKGSFHGRTLATLSATGQDRYKKNFEPLLKEFKHVEYGKAEEIEKAITRDTAAVMLEPILGEGGVVIPPKNYLREVKEICEENGILMILDEVQTGLGRVGEIFAWKLFKVEPDIFTLAKSLGGGFPIGAMLAKENVMDAFKPGDHASTFGGNHLACASAKAVIETIIEENLCKKAKELGEYMMDKLKNLQKYSIVKEIRGVGLMIGIELNIPCKKFVDKARERGLLINCTQERVIRLLPPLIVSKKQIREAIRILEEIFKNEN